MAAIEEVTYLGAPVPYAGIDNDVYLVIDTRRFAQFSIDALKYDVYINGLQKGASTSNLAADLSLTVLDSVGISFANFMQWLMDEQMQTNYDGIVFMLKTVFIGHHPDGTTETVMAETIPMHLNRMDINLDYAKGSYQLEFMPNMNFDVNRHSRFMTIGKANSFKTSDGNKLGSIIDSFELQLNKASNEYYDQVQVKANEATSGGSRRDSGKLGRKVQYAISVPMAWREYEMVGSNPGKVTEGVFSKIEDANKKAQEKAAAAGQTVNSTSAVRQGALIPDVMNALFRQVPKIAEMGNFKTDGTTDGYITFYKYITGITSSNEVLMIHLDVVEFKVPNIVAAAKNPSQVSASDSEFYDVQTLPNGSVKRTPKNFIEWDYIFTGTNTSIIGFDMKIQDFQFLLASNLKVGAGAISDTSMEVSAGESTVDKTKNTELLFARKYDPLMLPLDTKAALDNYSQYHVDMKKTEEGKKLVKEGQDYAKNLSLFYASSPITVQLTIKGNPLIMHKFNMGTFLNHEKPSFNGVNDKAAYRQQLENEILGMKPAESDKTNFVSKSPGSYIMRGGLDSKSYAVSPVFAKINIKGPNVDFRTNEASASGDYATSVLSDNFYKIFKVTNIIQGHLFTQELELYSHNIFGSSKIKKG